MAPRIAKALAQLRTQLNEMAPKRSKKSDGWIGDAAHAARHSDHNPNAAGVVCALDITDDDDDVDGVALAEALRAAKDPRINYVIAAGRIFNSKNWKWRKYSGVNGHFHHTHISVQQDAKLYDDARPWLLPANLSTGAVRKAKSNQPDQAVKKLQEDLWGLGYTMVGRADGLKGKDTDAAILTFRKEHGLALTTAIDDALLLAVAKAKPRETVRTSVPAEKVKEIVPEARSNAKAKAIAVGGAVVTGAGTVIDGALDTIDRVQEKLNPFNAFFGMIPGWAWFGLAFLLLLALLWYIYKTEQRQVLAWKSGARR